MSRVVLQKASSDSPIEVWGEDVVVDHFPFVIGRHPQSDYPLPLAVVSRRHCELFEREGRVWVRDLGSCNGTAVNGWQARQPKPLHNGDLLRLASLVFHVSLEGAPTNPIPDPGAPAGDPDR
jgi:pSer/pThr/pTyr-binding forkhead associated (FHA) protein